MEEGKPIYRYGYRYRVSYVPWFKEEEVKLIYRYRYRYWVSLFVHSRWRRGHSWTESCCRFKNKLWRI